MELNMHKVEQYIADHTDWEYANEYGEPGYGSWRTDTTVVVLGDYWLRPRDYGITKDTHMNRGRTRRPNGDYNPVNTLRSFEDRYPRLWAQLEAQGVCFEWYDEWAIDYETSKAYRTTADSYSWETSIVHDEYGEMLTPDTDLETWMEWATNDETRCLTDNMMREYGGVATALKSQGFERYDVANGRDYRFENGWHPGQTDTPAAVTEMIRRQYGPDVEIVFCIDGVGQFDVAFGAYTRGGTTTDEDDETDEDTSDERTREEYNYKYGSDRI